MSTNININVGDNKLLNQARLQQNASRQAQLEKEANKRLQSEAEIERVNALAAQGKDANGNSLTGTRTQVPQLEQRPAANRTSGGPSVLIEPSQDYGEYGLAIKTKNIKNKIAALSRGNNGIYLPSTDPNNLPLVYASSGGPTNAPYLTSAEPEADVNKTRRLWYMLCDNNDVRAAQFSSTNQGSWKVLTGPTLTEQIPTQIKTPIHTLKKYTIECYLQAPAGNVPTGSLPVNFAAATTWQVSVQRTNKTDFGLFYANLDYVLEQNAETPTYTFALGISTVNSDFAVGLEPPNQQIIWFGATTESPDFNNLSPYYWPSRLQFGSWYHFAYVRDGNTERWFFEGTLLTSVSGNYDYVSADSDMGLSLIRCDFINSENTMLKPGIQGLRFTPKVLYTENFTPPPVINSLA